MMIHIYATFFIPVLSTQAEKTSTNIQRNTDIFVVKYLVAVICVGQNCLSDGQIATERHFLSVVIWNSYKHFCFTIWSDNALYKPVLF